VRTHDRIVLIKLEGSALSGKKVGRGRRGKEVEIKANTQRKKIGKLLCRNSPILAPPKKKQVRKQGGAKNQEVR